MSRQRKKKGRPISGWVILDKPVGIGSTQCVGKIKWLYQAAKAGHAGTLDPLASGMLPLALGEATRTVPYIMDGQKTYRFTVTWGAETNTDDLEGEVVNTSDNRPTKEAILSLLPNYTGEIEQVPPKFSAIKIDGERAYKLAREGEEVQINARQVEIETLELIERLDLWDSVSPDEERFRGELTRRRDKRRVLELIGREGGGNTVILPMLPSVFECRIFLPLIVGKILRFCEPMSYLGGMPSV